MMIEEFWPIPLECSG